MKNTKVLLMSLVITLVVMLFSTNSVYADSCSVDMVTDRQNYAPGQEVKITVSLSNIESSRGVYGLQGVLDYQKDVFEEITSDNSGNTTSIKSLNNWGTPTYNAETSEFQILTTSPVTTEEDIMEITLKIKEDAPLGTATIMLNNLQPSDSVTDLDASPEALRINIKDPSEIDEEDIPIIGIQPSPTPSTQPILSVTSTPTSTTIMQIVATPTATPDPSKLPQTGIENTVVVILFGTLVVSLISYIAYRRYKDI